MPGSALKATRRFRRMTVKPRFWIVKQSHDPAAKVRDKTVTYRKDMASRYRKESSQSSFYYDSMNWPLCAVPANPGLALVNVSLMASITSIFG